MCIVKDCSNSEPDENLQDKDSCHVCVWDVLINPSPKPSQALNQSKPYSLYTFKKICITKFGAVVAGD